MKTIPLTKGYVAMIDDEDYSRVSALKWHALARRPPRNVYGRMGGQPRRLLHHFILNLPPGSQVDHRDGNGLNCQKHNLRPATCSQNSANSHKQNRITSSQFKGVAWHKATRKWRVKVGGDWIGLFKSEIEAARAYDEAAQRYYGDYALTNF